MAGNGKGGDNRRHGYVGERTQFEILKQDYILSVIRKQGSLWMLKHLGVSLKV